MDERLKEISKRELSKLKEVFEEIEVIVPKKSTLYNVAQDLYELAKSYYLDAKYFFEKESYLECFELTSYTWGILDSMARIGFINPKKTRKYFKIEQ